MGRLCGGAHEISGIKAPLFLCGWVGVGWIMGWVGVEWGGGGGVGVVGWWGGGAVGWVEWCVWCAGEGCCGWWMKGG